LKSRGAGAVGDCVDDGRVTIHGTDPFATPEESRSPVRRLRGRLPAAVTLWTAPGPAGLTVSSTVVADGEPAALLGLIDDESDLWAAARAAGVFAVTVLGPADRQLADRFAGLLPAPGGLFAASPWRPTQFGPVPEGARTWAGCRLTDSRPLGWALLVTGEIEQVDLGDGHPLVHYRGRYRELA
jgi:3-hydroxy-9,10-secoandrosta-1,3,5(10)-triene-9,17-dione monooxygenase reductase component